MDQELTKKQKQAVVRADKSLQANQLTTYTGMENQLAGALTAAWESVGMGKQLVDQLTAREKEVSILREQLDVVGIVTSDTFPAFREAYNEAVGRKDLVFEFDKVQVLVGYAKYFIEYYESLEKRSMQE